MQVKRIHEYKRQLLNVLHVVTRYHDILADPQRDWVPRTVIFAGKAASSYHMAKQIIRLIHDVGQVINHDPRIGDRLKVVFVPNYGVSVAEIIMPGADLSEQISTAGTEASGTGNMKLALNGALTIGTDDGANIEIRQRSATTTSSSSAYRAHEVAALRESGYQPLRIYDRQPAAAGGAATPSAAARSRRDEPARYRGAGRCAAVGRRPLPAAGRLRRLRRGAGARRRAVPRPAGLGPRGHRSTSPAWACSRPTARSASTPREIWNARPARQPTAASLKPPCSTTTTFERCARAGTATPSRVLGPARRPDGSAWLAALPARRRAGRWPWSRGSGERLAALQLRDAAGLFEGALPGRGRLPAAGAAGPTATSALLDDPYRFGPVLGEMDAWLLGEGSHLRPFEILGATPRVHGRRGRLAASPCGRRTPSRVSVVGDFNLWDGRRHPMRLRRECGVWEIFLPGVAAGARYKFELLSRDGAAAAAEGRPLCAPGRAAPGHRQRGGAAAAGAAGLGRSASAPMRWTRR